MPPCARPHANDLAVYDGGTVVAHHERLGGRFASRLVLDHYLEALPRKPGAFPGSTALEQARAAGLFTPLHDQWWTAARRCARGSSRDPRADRGPAAGTAHGTCACGGRARGGLPQRRADRGRGRTGGPQGRRGDPGQTVLPGAPSRAAPGGAA
ncbi:hypothetical protein [Streptomyces sp. CBMA152]|uniref:hypothetical protein n=1 Tax=Streptomyces sp. CBMA152 TaxID=1896312 RepID=UPI001660D2E1|nr:hypothetical protein [Streptomyces sp. CBMA152]